MSHVQRNPALISQLKKFAFCELSLEQLRETMRGSLEVGEARPWLNLHSVCPEPQIRITSAHIEKALEMRRQGRMTERQLIDWATTLLTNNVFYWDIAEEKIVAAWINGVSLDLIPSDSPL